ncbi:MAG: ThiF family adenylyltransferase [Flavobacteriaceae bacterium]|nr:ThiF family adenylyltransferase [Flavobacteriaceae bacterium]MCY4267966.1 ThiF family adenylyltransferase [Flavobacteriaceae bacterium]MCY4299613.1 ThiF family adenylyltransferase [Flavobacteriaceae bacterium]
MSDRFSQIRKNTLAEVKNILDDEIEVLADPKEANFLEAKEYCEIWQVNTGLYDDIKSVWLVEELTMYIAFTKQFPLEPVKIYYDKNDFEKLGYVPHSSFLRNDVCVFDEFVIVDQSNPSGIILDQLEKAKQTLIQGIKGENTEDFEDEFMAYWNTSGNSKDKLFSEPIYSIISEVPTRHDSLLLLTYEIKSTEKDKIVSGILYNKEEDLVGPYREYLEKMDFKPKEYEVFFVGGNQEISHPPFALNCMESLGFVYREDTKNFKEYYNRNSKRILVFSKTIAGETHYLGWIYPEVNSKINGFRKSELTPFNLTFKKGFPGHKKYVKRFSLENLNEQRLIKRTATEAIPSSNYKFLVAGIGSVGSYLVNLLNNLNNPEFTLIDTDKLSSENIKRHLLGFQYLNQNKAIAVKTFLKHKLPGQRVHISESSIFDFYNEDEQEVNEQDYIFLCLGKLNLEKWFIDELEKGKLKKPVFILWVEPYLIGGQLLYLHPDNLPKLDELFEDVFKYRFSVIEPGEFEGKRNLFILKESGCQSTYSPYSSAHLSLFLSSVHPKIFEIIEQGNTRSSFFTWIGDIDMAKKLDIGLRSESFERYSLIQNEL